MPRMKRWNLKHSNLHQAGKKSSWVCVWGWRAQHGIESCLGLGSQNFKHVSSWNEGLMLALHLSRTLPSCPFYCPMSVFLVPCANPATGEDAVNEAADKLGQLHITSIEDKAGAPSGPSSVTATPHPSPRGPFVCKYAEYCSVSLKLTFMFGNPCKDTPWSCQVLRRPTTTTSPITMTCGNVLHVGYGLATLTLLKVSLAARVWVRK